MLEFIFGAVARLIPEAFKLYDKQMERKHEREMLDLQMKADKLRAELEIAKLEKESEMKQQLAEIQAMIAATQAQATTFQRTGNKWLDAMLVLAETASSFVRPVLTYWFAIGVYGTYKAAVFYTMLDIGGNWKDAVTTAYTPQDLSIVLSIIGFWFVDRAIRKPR